MIVHYTPEFIKVTKKLNVRIRKSLKARIAIFYKYPNDPRLNNHPLKREWREHRSIDINAGWRAIYKEIKTKEEKTAYFVAIGTHKDYTSNSAPPRGRSQETDDCTGWKI